MKYDWYQTDAYVVVSVLTKNCKKEEVIVDITDQALSVLRESSGTREELCIRLYQPIKAQEASYKILSTKIEVKLPKIIGERWPCIECGKDTTKPSAVKNWDSITVPEEEAEGDQALNQLFQKIYKDADEDTRKAMNKSYMESGGTVLSTNWTEVGRQKVDVKPPDGMEYKKYEQ